MSHFNTYPNYYGQLNQTSFANSGFELVTKLTRMHEFSEEMNFVVPRTELVPLIQSHSLIRKTGRL